MIPTPKKIVLIDDDVLIRETVRLALAHAGFEVAVCDDPSKAQEQAKAAAPDLIIMDLYMPNLDGLELCRKLKGDPQLKDIPVVFFTGSTEDIDKLSGMAAGAYDYITKPIDGRKLVEKIRAILKLGKKTDAR